MGTDTDEVNALAFTCAPNAVLTFALVCVLLRIERRGTSSTGESVSRWKAARCMFTRCGGRKGMWNERIRQRRWPETETGALLFKVSASLRPASPSLPTFLQAWSIWMCRCSACSGRSRSRSALLQLSYSSPITAPTPVSISSFICSLHDSPTMTRTSVHLSLSLNAPKCVSFDMLFPVSSYTGPTIFLDTIRLLVIGVVQWYGH